MCAEKGGVQVGEKVRAVQEGGAGRSVRTNSPNLSQEVQRQRCGGGNGGQVAGVVVCEPKLSNVPKPPKTVPNPKMCM